MKCDLARVINKQTAQTQYGSRHYQHRRRTHRHHSDLRLQAPSHVVYLNHQHRFYVVVKRQRAVGITCRR